MSATSAVQTVSGQDCMSSALETLVPECLPEAVLPGRADSQSADVHFQARCAAQDPVIPQSLHSCQI